MAARGGAERGSGPAPAECRWPGVPAGRAARRRQITLSLPAPPSPASDTADPPRSPFVDSHAHLADPAFEPDRDAAVERARLGGAAAIVCIGESLAAARGARELAARFPGLVAWTAGIHPYDAGGFDPARDLPALRQALADGACAVGECGLDFHHADAPRLAQLAAFEAQVALAAEVGRPVVVHSRDADDDMRALVADAGRRGVLGVLHCCTGPVDLARTALDAGWSVSFSGIITFRSWSDVALLRLPPDDRLMAESDAPYLAPVPHRGHRNEPAWVPSTIAALAAARGASIADVTHATAESARQLFGLPGPRPLGG